MMFEGEVHPLERAAQNRYRLMLTPGLLLLLAFFVWPLLGIAGRSVYTTHITLVQYKEILTDPVYFDVIVATFRISGTVTLICAIISYPVAYILAHARSRMRNLLLIAVILPYFTSVMVRTYAWIVLLGRDGLVNQYLRMLGLSRVELLYNETGILIGMSYVLLPLMILTLLAVMRGIDQRLIAAALGLGGNQWYAFRRIFLPLSLPGLAGGMLLVFILSVGFYITPALMGGSENITISMLIQNEVETTINWSFASALGLMLLAVTLVAFAIYARFISLERLLKSGA
jgi:putative spermidine/putrescine transport system permease protein